MRIRLGASTPRPVNHHCARTRCSPIERERRRYAGAHEVRVASPLYVECESSSSIELPIERGWQSKLARVVCCLHHRRPKRRTEPIREADLVVTHAAARLLEPAPLCTQPIDTRCKARCFARRVKHCDATA